jgi:hypothetical protein
MCVGMSRMGITGHAQPPAGFKNTGNNDDRSELLFPRSWSSVVLVDSKNWVGCVLSTRSMFIDSHLRGPNRTSRYRSSPCEALRHCTEQLAQARANPEFLLCTGGLCRQFVQPKSRRLFFGGKPSPVLLNNSVAPACAASANYNCLKP